MKRSTFYKKLLSLHKKSIKLEEKLEKEPKNYSLLAEFKCLENKISNLYESFYEQNEMTNEDYALLNAQSNEEILQMLEAKVYCNESMEDILWANMGFV